MLKTEWSREENTNLNFPNITILNVLADGVLSRYEAMPNDGYVMHRTDEEEHWVQDSPESEPYPVTYYYTLAGFPVNYNFDNFTWEAVPRSEVNQKYIME